MKKVCREAFQVILHATEKSQVYFVAVILKVLLVNLLKLGPNCRSEPCQRFLKNITNAWNIKNVKNVNNVAKIKKT